jgi:predicted site-specific integrase-resolvase
MTSKSQNIEDLWTFEDIAKYLKISISTVYKNWHKMGIRPVVAYPGAKPRFYKSDVLNMVGKQK